MVQRVLFQILKKTVHSPVEIRHPQYPAAQAQIQPIPVLAGEGEAVVGDAVCVQELPDEINQNFFHERCPWESFLYLWRVSLSIL